jgi:hypothetical protein
MCVFWQINRSVGFVEELGSVPVMLVLSLVCSLLPLNMMVILAVLLMTVQLASVSLVAGAAFFLLLALMFLLYLRFTPKDALFLLLMPIMSVFGVPYAVPVTVGLAREPRSAVSVGFGSLIYYVVRVISENAGLLVSDSESGTGTLKLLANQFTQDRFMIAACVIYVVTTVIVYVIRRLSVDNAWAAAIGVGHILQFILLIGAGSVFHSQIGIIKMIIGLVISSLICVVYQFFVFDVDYKRTERVQFEDDEYYYYIKAVPKRVIEIPKKQVKSINKSSNTTSFSQISRELPQEPDER